MSDPRTVFPDNIYTTLTYSNKADTANKLQFASNNGNDICPNPSMYYLIITKFVLPNNAFPIFKFDNRDQKMFFRANGDPDEYFMEMPGYDYRGDYMGGSPTYFSNGFISSAPIYFIGQFRDMMNHSFNKRPGNDTRLVWNDDGTFEILSSINRITLSPAVYKFFPSMPATLVNGMYELYFTLLNDPGDPDFPLYSAKQEFKSLYALSDIKSILLLSNDLPILFQGFISSDSATQREKVLNQFFPTPSENVGVDRTDWIFEAGELQPIDMISQEGFSNFEFDVRVIRANGEVLNYYVMPGETASVTFRFAKRALFNNEYNLSNETARIKQNPSVKFHRRY